MVSPSATAVLPSKGQPLLQDPMTPVAPDVRARGLAARLSFVAALFLFAAVLVAGLALVAPR